MAYTGPCPNKNSKEWKDLVKYLGDRMAYLLFDKNGDKPFTEHPYYLEFKKEYDEESSYILTAKKILDDIKAEKEAKTKEPIKEEEKNETAKIKDKEAGFVTTSISYKATKKRTGLNYNIMAKKIFGTISCIAGISGMIFCLYELIIENGNWVDFLAGFVVFVASFVVFIYPIGTKFWQNKPSYEIRSKKYKFILLKIYGLISLTIGTIGAMVIIYALLNIAPNDHTNPYLIFTVFLLFCSIITYSLLIKFWSLKLVKQENDKPIQYFKFTKSILLPIKSTKILLISLILLGFIHVYYKNEISASPLSEGEIYFHSHRIKDMYKNLQYIYLGYLIILSSLILSAKILPIENVSEPNNQEKNE